MQPRNMFCLFVGRNKATHLCHLFRNMFKKVQEKNTHYIFENKKKLHDILGKEIYAYESRDTVMVGMN